MSRLGGKIDTLGGFLSLKFACLHMFWHPWRTESPSLSMGMIQGGEEMYDWGMMGMSGAHQLKRNAVVNQFSENTWVRAGETEGGGGGEAMGVRGSSF